MSEQLAKAEALFHEACDLAPEQREPFLQQACRGDADLLREVSALLGASGIADQWLKDSDYAAAGFPLGPSALDNLSEGPGTVVGRYKLLEKIGEGGFGVVYMAEQQEPVRRKVAFKIIKLGMDTRQVIARFEAERQALALMDHPNIAKVLDGGATDTGRSYFVMELVPGVPITTLCDQNRLSTQDRLKLFIVVCHAIQHAHQKGVIHRDLKPTNVLVTLNDGVPHPMVIDFGVAKATNQKLTEKTLFTNFATMIGTPAYMSPEQAEMSKLDVDTRSDIYSLGVLLYELLTGTTPFPEQRLNSVAYAEMQRIIAQEVPERPSTRLRKTALAASREAHMSRPSALTSDLDWIVMKCLEKDRNRRYETANALAMDLERHLNQEPVLARPPSSLYEFQKSVRRHKIGFAATATVIMALAVGVAVSAWQTERARQAEREQRRLRADAQMALEASQRNAAEMVQHLGDPAGALAVLERAVQSWPDHPQLWSTKGLLLEQNGRLDEAVEDFTRAIKLIEAMPDMKQVDLNEALAHRSRLLKRLGRFEAAGRDFCRINGIPLRDPRAPRALIDLSLFYDVPLTESLQLSKGLSDNILEELPQGLQVFGGVRFDTRGVVELNGTRLVRGIKRTGYRFHYRQGVTNIPVRMKFTRLHCFMGTGWSVPDGIQIGTFTLHFSNGQTNDLPICYGIHVRDFVAQPAVPDNDEPLPHGAVAWTGMNGYARNVKGHIRLYVATWNNPHPNEEVGSMDFVSTMSDCAPVLIAMTVEP